MNDTGTLSAVAADPDSYRPIAETQVFEQGHEAWGPMALASGRLIVRDLRRMTCLEVGGE